MTSTSQWFFSIPALNSTPSTCSLEKELYDRARGVEFLFRLGSSLALPTSAMCTAATWFHRFYMRYPMDDFHRQDVAATCIFLSTKTEECGRKLRDVARVYQAKVNNMDITQIAVDSKEVDQCQSAILLTEEVLLEALCFDFVVESPHAELLELFESCSPDSDVQEYAWSLAHDSYRTPVCILYPPRVIATACYVLAQRIVDGPNSPSLDARISAAAPSKSLPTPPSNKPPSPDAARAAIEHYNLNEEELSNISETLSILLEFYSAQDQITYPYLASITAVPPPARRRNRNTLFVTQSVLNSAQVGGDSHPSQQDGLGRTPSSSHGGRTPSTQTSQESHKVPLQQHPMN
ncbi:cyclin-like protein [Phlegmacium glaucopus]|nr:cyclin-like protein [Phlegmacium glaucopus]